MNFSFSGNVRLDHEKYAPTRFLPPPSTHGQAYPRIWMFCVAGMAFNFSAIDVAETRRLRTAARRAIKSLRAEQGRAAEINSTAGDNKEDNQLLNLPGLLTGF
jgi:hypothetical protein